MSYHPAYTNNYLLIRISVFLNKIISIIICAIVKNDRVLLRVMLQVQDDQKSILLTYYFWPTIFKLEQYLHE